MTGLAGGLESLGAVLRDGSGRHGRGAGLDLPAAFSANAYVDPTASLTLQLVSRSGVCVESRFQTMHGDREVELAKIATLAHFEAILRGRADAARFLDEVFAAQDPDVEVSVKK